MNLLLQYIFLTCFTKNVGRSQHKWQIACINTAAKMQPALAFRPQLINFLHNKLSFLPEHQMEFSLSKIFMYFDTSLPSALQSPCLSILTKTVLNRLPVLHSNPLIGDPIKFFNSPKLICVITSTQQTSFTKAYWSDSFILYSSSSCVVLIAPLWSEISCCMR